ncbi:Stk1 family PASTA domain-containing Ser/Thr kinase [Acetivibrio sp. MSJd-27]|uniref:Stk1 family PASTA domain-containing Ser/Thr kinase n=1 Tax=Acetivibrio sp. MSJd-27 TaxID=2841523 RepID=UPI0015B254F0|nr:Stk1 family PASTA domain-containing Ser/Thr kinase [Acetivibrio sp. MSJd-27]MBU5450699.1 Stk1 family PASTA domain-containing Ser/Thr kinase [Acetivibrio sp. MSJd-27]
MSLVGKILSNRYEIIEEIGNGGMAVVYKARCRLLNRYVAIKVLRDEYKVDKEFVKRFNRESQAAASLSNPHIVSVYDVGNDNGIYYIVMELVEGVTLKDYIQKNGMLPWRLALKFSLQICSALDHAHKNGIVHRDIKPQNIIITRDGTIKVTDFGIARISNSSETRKIDEGIMGSVHYISPEDAKGVLTDARSDLYSLGVTMYEMLTGKVPYDGESAVSIAIMHLQSNYTPIKELNITVPLGFVQIVERAMQKDINLRYQTAGELWKDLMSLSQDPELFEPDNVNAAIADLGETKLITKDERQEIKKQIDDMKQPEAPAEKSKKKDGKKKKKKSRFRDLFKAETKQDKVAVTAAIVTSVILFVAILSIGIGILFPNFSLGNLFKREEFTVPDIVGQKLDDVKEQYKDKKIEFVVEEELFDEEHETGTILSQNPEKDMTIKLPGKIKITVSKGGKEVTVPRFIDKEYRQAVLEINNLGLKADTNFVVDDSVPEGYVISQTPQPDSKTTQGSTVTLTISKGAESELTEVPNLVGMTTAQAKRAISTAGLVLGSIIRQESDQPVDTVISQTIKEKSEVNKKTEISITVSSGKTATEPPKTQAPTHEPTKPPTTQAPSGQKKQTINIDLPTDRNSVRVRIEQDGKTVYNQTVNTSQKTLSVTLTGEGKADILIYFDDVLARTKVINF